MNNNSIDQFMIVLIQIICSKVDIPAKDVFYINILDTQFKSISLHKNLSLIHLVSLATSKEIDKVSQIDLYYVELILTEQFKIERINLTQDISSHSEIDMFNNEQINDFKSKYNKD